MLRLARSLRDVASAAERSEIVSLIDEIILLIDRPERSASPVDQEQDERGAPAALRLIDRVLQGIPL